MLEQLFAAACFIGLLAFWRLWLEERKRRKRAESLHYLSRIGTLEKPIEDFTEPVLVEKPAPKTWFDEALELARKEAAHKRA